MLFGVQRSGKKKARATNKGAEYSAAIGEYLAEFRAEASGTQQLPELEEKAIRLLPHQIVVVQEKLAYQWQNFNITESAVPLGCLASDTMLHGTMTRYDANAA